MPLVILHPSLDGGTLQWGVASDRRNESDGDGKAERAHGISQRNARTTSLGALAANPLGEK